MRWPEAMPAAAPVALAVALTLAWTLPLGYELEGGGGARLHSAPVAAGVVGFGPAWTTMECAYHHQRRQLRMFHAEAVRQLALVGARVDTLSSPSRTRLTAARKR
ncbi:hypothetical protein OG912_15900 [Streptomyces sp. NBC_00464]|uniref:hypothetical protein n=1 Tax=Streptomyces sp. NBC_00464 TaxID=2975751 RepID=UPI002E184207